MIKPTAMSAILRTTIILISFYIHLIYAIFPFTDFAIYYSIFYPILLSILLSPIISKSALIAFAGFAIFLLPRVIGAIYADDPKNLAWPLAFLMFLTQTAIMVICNVVLKRLMLKTSL